VSELSVIDGWSKELANIDDVKELLARDQKAEALQRVFFKDSTLREQQLRIVKYRIARQGQRTIELMRERGELWEKGGDPASKGSLQTLGDIGIGKTKADNWRKKLSMAATTPRKLPLSQAEKYSANLHNTSHAADSSANLHSTAEAAGMPANTGVSANLHSLTSRAEAADMTVGQPEKNPANLRNTSQSEDSSMYRSVASILRKR